MSCTRTTAVRSILALTLAAGSAAAQTNPPDSFADRPGARGTRPRIAAPVGSTVNIFPTNNAIPGNGRITNGDGSEVRYSLTSLPPGQASFGIPGIINGLRVTDHTITTELVGMVPVDSRLSAFNDGVMIDDTLGTWLENQGHQGDTRLAFPFFTSPTGLHIFGGIDLTGIGLMGQMFADNATPGQVFNVGPNGMLDGLDCFKFYLAMPTYAEGQGWIGPLVPEGTSVAYLGVGDIAATPTPGAAVLLVLGALAATRRRRA